MINNKLAQAIAVTLCAIAIAGCTARTDQTQAETGTDEQPQNGVTLTVSGSGGTTTILQAIKSEFEADTPGYTLEILTGTGTGGGVEGVTTNLLTIAAMARPPKDAELEAAPSFQYVEFGLTGQAAFVSADVGDMSLTGEQMNAIFFGEVANWAEVGGPDAEIFVYVRDEGDSSTSALREVIFGEDPFVATAQVISSQGDMIAAVEGTPFSVGFGTWPAVLAAGADVRAVALDGASPGDVAYPVTGPLGIGFLGENAELVQSLVDWLLGDRGREALQEFDVIVTP